MKAIEKHFHVVQVIRLFMVLLFFKSGRNQFVMYQSNRTFNIPPGIPPAFDVFSCLGGREFDELSLPGDRAFDYY